MFIVSIMSFSSASLYVDGFFVFIVSGLNFAFALFLLTEHSFIGSLLSFIIRLNIILSLSSTDLKSL